MDTREEIEQRVVNLKVQAKERYEEELSRIEAVAESWERHLKLQKENPVLMARQTTKPRKLRDLSLVTGILAATSGHLGTVALFIEGLPPDLAKDLKEADTLILKARDLAVEEFSRLERE